MPLTAGTRLGPYEVTAPLGAGGMGEVYRAKDTRLGRMVAVKVLHASATGSPDSRRRFEQEARAASALDHPNVVVLHDVGDHGGAPYVVTELLEGTTLRELLAGGALPPARAVAIAADVARGLAAAHDRGIVHRDIKPENVFVTRDGRVKILDFGVATFVEAPGRDALETTIVPGTEPGVVLGTVGYMAPEQVRGERADARSDVFALGVVLYELLSGRRPFTGASKVETLHAILTATPADLSEPPAAASPAIARIVGHCLGKDPSMRFQAARDVAFALEAVGERTSGSTGAIRSSRGSLPGRGLAVAGWVVGTAALAALATQWACPRPLVEPPVVRFEIPAPANGALQGILGVSSAISPDGSTIVLAVTTETGHRLYLRRLDSTAAVPVEGSEGAVNPFWSPDGRSVGFFAPGKLKRAPASGGPAQTICELGTSYWTTGTWGVNDTILVMGATLPSHPETANSILQVAASGSDATVALSQAAWGGPVGWASMLPDGRHYLFYAFVKGKPSEVRIGTIGSAETKTVTQAFSRAVYAPPGYLLFVRDGTLVAQRFDTGTMTVSGTPQAVADGLVYLRPVGSADFSVSNNGVLAYQAGDTASRLAWYGRNGIETGAVGEPADYYFMALSPKGDRVAVAVMDPKVGVTDITLFNLLRGGPAINVTSDQFVEWTPAFSPDGQQLAFSSNRQGPPHVHVKRLNDAGAGEALVPPDEGGSVQFVTDWSSGADGPYVVYHIETRAGGDDIFAVPLSRNATPRPLVRSQAGHAADGRVSPDGRWLAYASTESGKSQIYIRSVGASPERWQVSTDGGVSPRWSRTGRELFYIATTSMVPFGGGVPDGTLMTVPYTADQGFDAGAPVPLFKIRARFGQYEPAPDGQRFLVNIGGPPLPITVSTNWLHALQ